MSTRSAHRHRRRVSQPSSDFHPPTATFTGFFIQSCLRDTHVKYNTCSSLARSTSNRVEGQQTKHTNKQTNIPIKYCRPFFFSQSHFSTARTGGHRGPSECAFPFVTETAKKQDPKAKIPRRGKKGQQEKRIRESKSRRGKTPRTSQVCKVRYSLKPPLLQLLHK